MFTAQLIVQSSSSGEFNRGHRYYKWVEGVENIAQSTEATKFGDFSIRASGEQCVSPGSIHPRTRQQYKVIFHAGPLTAPTPQEIAFWNSECLPKTSKPLTTPTGERRLLKHGQMHGAYVAEAGRLWNRGYEQADVVEMTVRWIVANSEDPVDEDKVRKEALNVTTIYERGAAPETALLVLSMKADDPNAVTEPVDPFHLVGLEPPKTGNGSTLCVFTNEADTKIAVGLGFNATTITSGEGAVPLSASITSLKMAYERVAIFGKNAVTEAFKSFVTPGSIYADFPSDIFGDCDDLTSAVATMGERTTIECLDKQLKRSELMKTSLLKDADAYKLRVNAIISTANMSLNSWNVDYQSDPRIVVKSTAEALKQLLEKTGDYPPPLTSTSLRGVLGQFVDIAYPTTAACRELLMGNMIPIIGSMFGKKTPSMFGSDVHPGVTFSLNIARTADGKGQALNHALTAIRAVDGVWLDGSYHANVSSGEGLIRLAGGGKLAMAGGDEVRIVLAVPEMTAIFTAQGRDGSTLSDMLRNGWDLSKLENTRSEKSKSTFATNYTMGVCGSITPDALRGSLQKIDWVNGSVNRFLWNVMSGSKTVSRSMTPPDFTQWSELVKRLYALNRHHSEGQQAVEYSTAGAKVWDAWVNSIPEYDDGDPMADGMARAKPHALRLANLYAQLDERRLDGWKMQLEPVHVEAAIELVERSRASMAWYLADQSVGGVNAAFDKGDLDRLRKMVAAAITETGAATLSSTEICRAFSHMTTDQRNEMCLAFGMVSTRAPEGEVVGSGRRPTMWVKVK